ncbi:glycoside hydrolase family 25 protein [Clostridium sp. UBA7339]|uniref:glycoside hydrolase family 25 protein n=1 Tax=Clostridium sp. UBA7339 TaxID=1946376 RepID=UPI0032176809
MNLKGIDVSHHQGNIDWDKVKSQIGYAILSVGYGDNITSQDDKQFNRNAKECTRLGIPFGVYIYSYATSTVQAKSESEHVLRLIKGYKLDYPVYYDLEDANTTGKCSNKLIADMTEVFCNAIEKAGYWAGIYANTSWFNNKLTDSRFNKWVKWVAQYNSVCTYKGNHDMWQYSSSGKVNGITGNVDMNYCYIDYPVLINRKETIIKPVNKEDVKVDYIIQYSNAVDQNIAEVMADRLNCPTINCLRPYAHYGQYKTVIAVGEAKNKSGYTNVLIQGKDREETLDKAIAYCKKLGR